MAESIIPGLSPAAASPPSEQKEDRQNPPSPLLFWRRGPAKPKEDQEEKGRRDDRRSQLLERATDRKQRVSASNGHPAKGEDNAPEDGAASPVAAMPLDLGKVKAAESPSRMSPSSSLAELRGQELVKTARDMQKLREDVEQLNVEKEELADDKMSLFQSLSQMRDQLDKQAAEMSVLNASLLQTKSQLNDSVTESQRLANESESDVTRALRKQVESLSHEKDAALHDVKTLQEVQMKSLKVITEIEGKVAKEQEKSKRDLAEMAATLMTLRHEAAGHQKQQSMMEGQLQTAMEENEALAQRKRFGCF